MLEKLLETDEIYQAAVKFGYLSSNERIPKEKTFEKVVPDSRDFGRERCTKEYL